MAEITTAGYTLKSQNDWYADEKALYTGIDANWNLDASTPDGLKMAHDAELLYAIDELIQQAYNSKDPAKAQGTDLDIIGSLTKCPRSAGSYSNCAVTFTGAANTVVPEGNTFTDTSGYVWALDDSVTLGSTGAGTGYVTCTTIGAIEASIGTITTITDVVAGLSAVTNPSVATVGTAAESDRDYRIRRALSVGKTGQYLAESLLGVLYNVDSVRNVKVYENATNATDSNGIPARNYCVLADGGDSNDIAAAMYSVVGLGVPSYQTATPVTVTVTSSTYSGVSKDIRFCRPTYVDMIVAMEIHNDGTLPSTIISDVQEAIIEYASGGFIADESGVYAKGFGIGISVPYSRLYAPINQVIGQYGNSYVKTLTLNGGASNVSIAFNELSRWTSANIAISVTTA